MLGAGAHQQPVRGEPRTAGPEVTTFMERDEKSDERSPEPEREKVNGQEHVAEKELPESPMPPMSPGATLARKFGSLLVGGRGDGHERRGAGKRASILTMTPRVSADSEKEREREREKEKEREHDHEKETDEREWEREKAQQEDKENKKEHHRHGIRESLSQPLGSIHRRAATILDPAGRTTRHERRSSTGAPVFVGGTIGRRTKPPSTANSVAPTIGWTNAEKHFDRVEETGDVEGNEERIPSADEEGHLVNGDGVQRKEDVTAEKDFKPVFLKGLFRYVPA